MLLVMLVRPVPTPIRVDKNDRMMEALKDRAVQVDRGKVEILILVPVEALDMGKVAAEAKGKIGDKVCLRVKN
jgi:hypothetical protein